MKRINLLTLAGYRERGEHFACLTAYDASFARTMAAAGIEVILVGDSLGMVLQGHGSTLPVTTADMAYHVAAVKRGTQESELQPMIMADLPFMSFATLDDTLANAGTLMQSGAQVVKIEGGRELAERVARLRENGVPCCVHLGLTPQSVNCFGGFRVQGREPAQAERMLEDVRILEEAGAAIVLLECVPEPLATRIQQAVSVPTIGIGAGPATDGQVLVMHDILGLGVGRAPRFVKNFLAGAEGIEQAFRAFGSAVREGAYPAPEHWFAE